MIKVIDNKKVDLTSDEYDLYLNLCKTYDEPHSRGAELFKGMFEVNEHGFITFVAPSPNRKFSMEVYCYLLSVQVSQQLRISRSQQDAFIKEAKDNHIKLFKETKEIINKLSKYSTLIYDIKEKASTNNIGALEEIVGLIEDFAKEEDNVQ